MINDIKTAEEISKTIDKLFPTRELSVHVKIKMPRKVKKRLKKQGKYVSRFIFEGVTIQPENFPNFTFKYDAFKEIK